MLVCSAPVPTHPKQALPPKNYCLSEIFFFFEFFSNSVNKLFFKIIKSYILIEESLQRMLLYALIPLIGSAVAQW